MFIQVWIVVIYIRRITFEFNIYPSIYHKVRYNCYICILYDILSSIENNNRYKVAKKVGSEDADCWRQASLRRKSQYCSLIGQIFCRYTDKAKALYPRIINVILLSFNKEELRTSM